ncbi:cysteine synthase family protein [Embleya sp. NPDC005575]|uniref:cysteine synthase family protein n=1 Tax=Embleya sp. NPDC005575 TaxID=3156892 RepID=UPI0033A41EAD
MNERAVNEREADGRAMHGRATNGKAMNERMPTGKAAIGQAAIAQAANEQAASRRTRTVGDAVAATEMPRLVRLDHNLYAACFTVMKLLPARYILDTAIRRGELRPGMTVVETSSGTFGLGLAMVTALRGYPLVLVSDPVLDAPLKARLEDLGARVEIVTEPAAVGGHQRARLDRLDTIRKECEPAFVPSQYDNPLNPAAYASVAELVRQRIGPVDTLVGCVGSGGSMCGTAHGLRRHRPQTRAVAVDTHHSVLFGLPDGPRTLRGLGNSLMPANVEHDTFDDVHWLGAAEAFEATDRLHREHALFMGPTSGAAYLVARWEARRHPDRTVLALFADEGHRYQSTSGDPNWRREHGLYLPTLPTAPHTVTDPDQVRGHWDHMAWCRRPVPDCTRPADERRRVG